MQSEGEFGMGIPPSKLIEETNFFFNVSDVINQTRKFISNKEKDKE